MALLTAMAGASRTLLQGKTAAGFVTFSAMAGIHPVRDDGTFIAVEEYVSKKALASGLGVTNVM